jgi:hypothetical protein
VLKSFPNNVRNVTTATGHPYSIIACGSIIIPTDTKKIAPNKSLTGLVRCSTFSADVVSAIIEPIMNAPSSAEKPICVASTTIPKQSPRDRISKVSSSRSFLAHFSSVGKRKIPAMNQRAKKKSSFKMV